MHDGLVQLHVRHTPGGVFTDRLFGTLEPPVKERDILRIEAPLGTFFLREDSSRPIVLLAGGTGFAPIKAIAEHAFHQRINRDDEARPARAIHLYWGARSAPRLCTWRNCPSVGSRAARLSLRPGVVRAQARGPVARPHRLRSSRCHPGSARSVGVSGRTRAVHP